MSKATKRKYVTSEILNDFILPDEKKIIVQVIASKGNNLHEVKDCKGNEFLVSMPTKYRKNIWIKRGDYVLVEQIAEGDKVQAEIVHILYKEQIQDIRAHNLWPAEFQEKTVTSSDQIPADMLPPSGEESGESDSENDDVMTISNPNRRQVTYNDTDDSNDSDDSNE